MTHGNVSREVTLLKPLPTIVFSLEKLLLTKLSSGSGKPNVSPRSTFLGGSYYLIASTLETCAAEDIIILLPT